MLAQTELPSIEAVAAAALRRQARLAQTIIMAATAALVFRHQLQGRLFPVAAVAAAVVLQTLPVGRGDQAVAETAPRQPR
jgi:hypothetical protein